MKPPSFDIDPAKFRSDPYPIYTEMRKSAPICYVPQLDAVLLTKRDDVFVCEKNVAVFSSEQPGGLMSVLMGENMMRKDGDAHMRERKAIFPSISPKTVAAVWKKEFQAKADEILKSMEGEWETDLVSGYAMQLSAEALKTVTGLKQVDWRKMDGWSQAMINGIANYHGDRETERICLEAVGEIDEAITERMDALIASPDHSLLSVMMASGMPDYNLRANIKLAISGGQNEQRDAIAGCVYALLSHPEEAAKVKSEACSWMQVFDEYCRWIAPIGMSPRRIAKADTYNGIDFEPEARAFLMFGSSNRDEACFDNPDIFDISRDTSKSIAFGAGPHFCAGSWISRALVAEVGVPSLFAAFPDLALPPDERIQFDGWAFRGLPTLPLTLNPS